MKAATVDFREITRGIYASKDKTHRYSPTAIDMHFVLDMPYGLDMCFAQEK